MSASRLAHAHHRATVLAVMAALLLAQTLGLLHRVVHAPQGHHAALGWVTAPLTLAVQAARVAQAAPADAAGPATPNGRWLDRLFAAHDDSGCESYDQLAHADVLWGPPLALGAPVVSAGALSRNPLWQLAAQAAGYLARGPPSQA